MSATIELNLPTRGDEKRGHDQIEDAIARGSRRGNGRVGGPA
jgi:hypothetical protein